MKKILSFMLIVLMLCSCAKPAIKAANQAAVPAAANVLQVSVQPQRCGWDTSNSICLLLSTVAWIGIAGALGRIAWIVKA